MPVFLQCHDSPRNLSGFDRSNPSALDALVADLSAMSIVQLRKQLREKGLPIDLEKEDAVRLLTKHAQAHDPALHAASPAKNGSVAGASSKVGASVPSASLLKPEPTELVKGTTRAFVENASIFLRFVYWTARVDVSCTDSALDSLRLLLNFAVVLCYLVLTTTASSSPSSGVCKSRMIG